MGLTARTARSEIAPYRRLRWHPGRVPYNWENRVAGWASPPYLGGEGPKKKKMQNEPKFMQAGVEICPERSQKRTHLPDAKGEGARELLNRTNEANFFRRQLFWIGLRDRGLEA